MKTQYMKYKIVGCENVEKYSDELYELRKKQCDGANYAKRKIYDFEREKLVTLIDEKERYGKSFINHLKGEVMNIMGICNRNNVNQVIDMVMKNWNKEKKKVLSYEKSLQNIRIDEPIYIHKKNFIINKVEDKYIVEINMYGKKVEALSRKRIFVIESKKHTEAILNNLISENYKKCYAEIIFEKGAWRIRINYFVEPKEGNLTKSRILGIDLGINNLFAIQVFDTNTMDWVYMRKEDLFTSGRQFTYFRKRTYKIKKYYETQIISETVSNDKKVIYRIKLNALPDKAEQFKKMAHNKYAKFIVDMAKKYNCGIIKMEDISTYPLDNNFLSIWPINELQKEIINMAKQEGVEVILVNPTYTSVRCSRCKNIDKEQKTNKTYICKCGLKLNNHLNAARNISLAVLFNKPIDISV